MDSRDKDMQAGRAAFAEDVADAGHVQEGTAPGRNYRLLLVLGFFLLALAVLIETAVTFGLSWVASYDTAVMSTVYPLRNTDLTAFLAVFTHLGDVLASIIISLAIFVWLVATKRIDDLFFFLVTFLSGQVLLWGTKYLVERARPETNIIALPADPSFPSGHAFTSLMLCAFIITFICLARQWNGRAVFVGIICALLVIYVIAMGFSRIYLGVHWPTDILEGWLMSSGWFCVCLAADMNRRQKRLSPRR